MCCESNSCQLDIRQKFIYQFKILEKHKKVAVKPYTSRCRPTQIYLKQATNIPIKLEQTTHMNKQAITHIRFSDSSWPKKTN